MPSPAELLATLEAQPDGEARAALALRLAEEGAAGLEAVLADLIGRAAPGPDRAGLIHALGYGDCSDHIDLLAELVATAGRAEAHEALQAIETVDEADPDTARRAAAVLRAARGRPGMEPWRAALLEDLAEILE